MRSYLKVVLTGMVVLTLLLSVASCSPGEETAAAPESEIATVQRGDLTVEITAVGNLALSRTEDLAFDLFYPKGTVEEVLVEAGDTVEEGQVVARLDGEEWEDELSTLEDAVTAAERALTTKQRALIAAERQIAAKELAVRKAELNLQAAENDLKEESGVKKAYEDVETAEYELNIATRTGTQLEIEFWQERLKEAREELDYILTGGSTPSSSTVALQLAQSIQNVDEKKRLLEDAQVAVEDAELAVYDAQIAVEDAQKNLQRAQEELDKAKLKSPLVKALFDGFITSVNVKGGDEVLNGTVAVQLADPDQFEAEISVSEMDIMQVEIGETAWIQVDALGGVSLPAEVTHISPTAVIQQGVVNYKVKVEVKSLEATAQEQQENRQQMMEDLSSGEMPERMKQAIAEGRLTQEQAEEIMERIQSGEMSVPPGGGGESGQSPFGAGGQIPSSTGSSQLPVSAPENFQLREGLTVTVSIIVSSNTDVLLVPNAAITTRGLETFVQVALEDGSVEERAIQTGNSDYQFTEVISGLEEGEEIIVPQGTVTTSTQQDRPGGFMIPGMGRR